MAKKKTTQAPPKKTFKVSVYDNQHKKNLALRASKVTSLYDSVVASIAQQASLRFEGTEPNDEFYWKDYPQLQKLADSLIDKLGSSLQTNIEEGYEEAWTLSNTKNDAMVDYLTQNFSIKQSVLDEMKHPHTEALAEFLKRRKEGMGLSDGSGNLKGVWNLDAFKSELELSLEACIGRGMSAADMSREIRQYLKYPDKLFRRVRDKATGTLRLSKAAAAFHPGRGVYRSSYKNALRLTATENNIAYRTADHTRWQKLDFVVGIEICISNNHPVADICDELCGKYPKEFKFTGWHPWCRCFAVAILASDDECERYFKAIENGEDVSGWNFKEKVTDMPDAWNKWVSDNKERIANAKSLPYFIKDNKNIFKKSIKQLSNPSVSDKRLEIPNGEYTTVNGSVKTPQSKLLSAIKSKNEYAKFEKEFNMAKVFADNGYTIVFNEQEDRQSNCDVTINGIEADLKSVGSYKQILHHALKATKKQKAKLVLFEFMQETSEIYLEIEKLRKRSIHGKFYFKGANIVYDF